MTSGMQQRRVAALTSPGAHAAHDPSPPITRARNRWAFFTTTHSDQFIAYATAETACPEDASLWMYWQPSPARYVEGRFSLRCEENGTAAEDEATSLQGAPPKAPCCETLSVAHDTRDGGLIDEPHRTTPSPIIGGAMLPAQEMTGLSKLSLLVGTYRHEIEKEDRRSSTPAGNVADRRLLDAAGGASFLRANEGVYLSFSRANEGVYLCEDCSPRRSALMPLRTLVPWSNRSQWCFGVAKSSGQVASHGASQGASPPSEELSCLAKLAVGVDTSRRLVHRLP